MKHFVGGYKPTSLLNDLEVSATRAFIEVFGDAKVTICLAGDERDANEDDILSNLCHMISGSRFLPPNDTVHVFKTVISSFTDQHSDETNSFLEYIQDNYIGRTGGQKAHIPVQLWSQFEAVVSEEDTCLSILLEGLKNAWNTESSQEELVWATLGRFGLEEELQAVRWREPLLEVRYFCKYCNILSMIYFLKSAKTFATKNSLLQVPDRLY